MSAIGEETGQLGYILKSLASFYKREVDSSIDSTIGLIEPIMIVTMGLMVSVLVMAIMLPVFSLAENF
jgi:type IV pilus assembly protein PilC